MWTIFLRDDYSLPGLNEIGTVIRVLGETKSLIVEGKYDTTLLQETG